MGFVRYISVVDIAVAAVAAFAILLPPRAMHAQRASRVHGEFEERAAVYEARALMRPTDARAVAAAAEALGDAGYRDWNVELARASAERAPLAPTAWLAMRAVAIGYLDRFEPKPALAWAQKAMTACANAGDSGCPPWDAVRLELLTKHIEGGVKSGIDPKVDPAGFNQAAGSGVRSFRTTYKAGQGAPTGLAKPGPALPAHGATLGSASAAPAAPAATTPAAPASVTPTQPAGTGSGATAPPSAK